MIQINNSFHSQHDFQFGFENKRKKKALGYDKSEIFLQKTLKNVIKFDTFCIIESEVFFTCFSWKYSTLSPQILTKC